MDTVEQTLWKAIEAHIGPEKTAQLRQTPLSGIVRQKVAHENGITPSRDTFVADLASVIGIKRTKKSEKYKTIKQAAKNLPDEHKAGSRSCFKKLATSEKYRRLEDRAKGREKRNIRQMRKEADQKAMTKIKKASGGLLSGLKEMGEEAVENYGSTAAKGLAGGAGASIPLYATGNMLIGDAEESGENLIGDARNKALQTGLGLGGMYLAGQGVSSYMDDDSPVKESNNKLSENELNEKLADFSAAVFIDNILEKTGSRQKHADLNEINTDFGVDIALDLLIR